ncbi:MAG: bifunctional phosphoribosyl-AMP cyclohydrolase/phosphoribosyl-ATP diphosphatase HisIE [Oscillospiraceae bacterium]|nr:bifunctional phosphoribosyl-AMP cyclohydrolase/phosphoribosyl-ATP diphosphatase HisIE [Oscillospiraceae bacterium]
MNIGDLNFSSENLIPAIIQDYYTKQVLTLAFMNRESLEISIKEGYTCFYSRSRKKLWRKGEESGNVQRIVNIKSDCDADSLIIEVIKQGPACHKGGESCFNDILYQTEEKSDFSINSLYKKLLTRKQDLPHGSYTSYLFEKGLDKILKKVGEECTEVVIAAKNPNKSELIYELSDLLYHALVLMVETKVAPQEILDELESRSNSGKTSDDT